MSDTNTLNRNDRYAAHHEIHDYIAAHYDTLGGWLVLRSVDISPHQLCPQFMLYLHRHGIETPGADVILALKYVGASISRYSWSLYLWDDAIWKADVSTERWQDDAGMLTITLLSGLNG